MAYIAGGSTISVSTPTQAVYINGSRIRYAWVQYIREYFGMTPATAIITLPYGVFESNYSHLREREITVYASHASRSSLGAPVFRGILTDDEASISEGDSSQSFIAVSMISRLVDVALGQNTLSGTVLFPRLTPGLDTDSGWTYERILEWMFDSDNLDSNWRALFELGDISILRKAGYSYDASDIVFHAQNYWQALALIADRVGGVVWRERFTGSKTALDLVPIGNPRSAVKRLSVPTSNRGPAQGNTILAGRFRRSASNVKTRVIGYGSPTQYMVTARTDDQSLLPAWPNATSYLESTITYAPEVAVLANPALANPKRPDFVDGTYNLIFRVFRLPEILRRMTVLDNNGMITDTEGQPLEIQVFQQFPVYAQQDPDANAGVQLQTTASLTKYQLIEGFKLDRRGFLWLPQPAVILYQVKKNGNNGADYVYARSHVYITLTVARPETQRPGYDTGTRGRILFGNIQSVGMAHSFVNESVKVQNVGVTSDDALTDSTGTTWTFGAIYYSKRNDSWSTQTKGTQTTIRDDIPILANLCEAKLKQSGARPITGTVELPYHDGSLRIGDGVIVDTNQNGERPYRLQVVGVSRTLFSDQGPTTVLELSNRVPSTVRTNMNLDNERRRLPQGGQGRQTFMGEQRATGPALMQSGMTAAQDDAAAKQNTMTNRAIQRGLDRGSGDLFKEAFEYVASNPMTPGNAGPSAEEVQERLRNK